MYDYIYNYFKEEIIPKTEKISDINIITSLHFYCAGAVHTFYKWLNEEYNYTDEDLTQILYNNIPTSIKLYLN